MIRDAVLAFTPANTAELCSSKGFRLTPFKQFYSYYSSVPLLRSRRNEGSSSKGEGFKANDLLKGRIGVTGGSQANRCFLQLYTARPQ